MVRKPGLEEGEVIGFCEFRKFLVASTMAIEQTRDVTTSILMSHSDIIYTPLTDDSAGMNVVDRFMCSRIPIRTL
jgi:hypothetical protein